mgnify:CR=1 FL=1
MKKSSDLKKGDKILIGTDILVVDSIETSDIGKQGVKKVRIVASKSSGEKIVIIRPADYPFKTE